LLLRPHDKVQHLGARIAGRFEKVADFRHLPVAAPFIALMPQWEFLDFVARVARRYPGFELRRSCAGESLLEEGGRVVGVHTSAGDDVQARLVIASDGRDSRFRAGLPQRVIGIHLAVQDAVAAANLLAAALARGEDVDARLPDVQARRMRPVQWTQGVQKLLQDAVIAPVLNEGAKLQKPPLAVRVLDAVPLSRRLPARVGGMGFRPEHVRSPDAYAR